MVPAVVVVRAVAIVLAVGLVVLALVRDEIAKREAIMGDDEIDALGWRRGAREYVARTCHASGDLAAQPGVAAPEAARGVAETVVPFGECGAKLAEAITARADVPGFGDEARLGEDGIGGERLKERRLWIKTGVAATERSGEVEAKSVETAVNHPALERADRHVNDQRAIKREAIAGARIVNVELRIVGFRRNQDALSRPRNESVGPSSSLSPLWLKTTSRIASIPAACSASVAARTSSQPPGARRGSGEPNTTEL